MKIVNGIPCVCLMEIAFVIWRDFFLQNKKATKWIVIQLTIGPQFPRSVDWVNSEKAESNIPVKEALTISVKEFFLKHTIFFAV